MLPSILIPLCFFPICLLTIAFFNHSTDGAAVLHAYTKHSNQDNSKPTPHQEQNTRDIYQVNSYTSNNNLREAVNMSGNTSRHCSPSPQNDMTLYPGPNYPQDISLVTHNNYNPCSLVIPNKIQESSLSYNANQYSVVPYTKNPSIYNEMTGVTSSRNYLAETQSIYSFLPMPENQNQTSLVSDFRFENGSDGRAASTLGECESVFSSRMSKSGDFHRCESKPESLDSQVTLSNVNGDTVDKEQILIADTVSTKNGFYCDVPSLFNEVLQKKPRTRRYSDAGLERTKQRINNSRTYDENRKSISNVPNTFSKWRSKNSVKTLKDRTNIHSGRVHKDWKSRNSIASQSGKSHLGLFEAKSCAVIVDQPKVLVKNDCQDNFDRTRKNLSSFRSSESITSVARKNRLDITRCAMELEALALPNVSSIASEHVMQKSDAQFELPSVAGKLSIPNGNHLTQCELPDMNQSLVPIDYRVNRFSSLNRSVLKKRSKIKLRASLENIYRDGVDDAKSCNSNYGFAFISASETKNNDSNIPVPDVHQCTQANGEIRNERLSTHKRTIDPHYNSEVSKVENNSIHNGNYLLEDTPFNFDRTIMTAKTIGSSSNLQNLLLDEKLHISEEIFSSNEKITKDSDIPDIPSSSAVSQETRPISGATNHSSCKPVTLNDLNSLFEEFKSMGFSEEDYEQLS